MTEEKKSGGEAERSRRRPAKKATTSAADRSAKPTAPENSTSDAGTAWEVTPEERWNMIAEAAYYLAEQRGFSGGHPAEDWKMAEAQIDEMLAKTRSQ